MHSYVFAQLGYDAGFVFSLRLRLRLPVRTHLLAHVCVCASAPLGTAALRVSRVDDQTAERDKGDARRRYVRADALGDRQAAQRHTHTSTHAACKTRAHADRRAPTRTDAHTRAQHTRATRAQPGAAPYNTRMHTRSRRSRHLF
eukprot:5903002-Pleurochrysis_carterae.AAC.6